MSDRPIMVEMRLVSDEDAIEILTNGLRRDFASGSPSVAKNALDALSRAHVLLLCPVGKTSPFEDEKAEQP